MSHLVCKRQGADLTLPNTMTDPVILSIIIRYLSVVINSITLVIGTIGGLCNLITFTSPKLRRSSCVFYLLCATAFQLISVLVIVPTRIALDYFGDGLEHRSIVFCKLRYYLVITLPELGTFYILFAILDRCLATSNHAHMRQWSQLKVAHRLAAITLIFSVVSNLHVFVFYTIYNGNCQASSRNFYALFITFYFLLVVIVLPLALMLILSIATVWHVRQTRRRVRPAATTSRTRLPIHRFEVRIITVGNFFPRWVSSIVMTSISDYSRSCGCNVPFFDITHGLLSVHHSDEFQFEQNCRWKSGRKLCSPIRCISVLS